MITFWVALGSWTAVFPGTLNRLVGLDYVFKDELGRLQGTFLAFTLGTLAVIVLVSVIGYRAAAGVRASTVEVPLGAPPPGGPLPPAPAVA